MENLVNRVIGQVSKVVLGKPTEVKLAVTCILANGHILIEDLPGMGKTTLAQVLAKAMGLSFQRTQFTSDMLPADVTGITIYDQETKTFVLHKGPIFSQLILADEINRASPKTQSALLEAMEEHQVSIDGETYRLPDPFFVIATQNPLFHAGTNPLPESQLDRFMMRLSLGFPDVGAEKEILVAQELYDKVQQVDTVLTTEQLQAIQQQVMDIHVSDEVLEYIIALCRVTRNSGFTGNPLSPRAGKAILKASKAWALVHERDYVIPEDVQSVFNAVAEHRIDAGVSQFEKNRHNLSAQILEQVDVLAPLS